jgi:hypothetical protein
MYVFYAVQKRTASQQPRKAASLSPFLARTMGTPLTRATRPHPLPSRIDHLRDFGSRISSS